jgi:hypothetical protein
MRITQKRSFKVELNSQTQYGLVTLVDQATSPQDCLSSQANLTPTFPMTAQAVTPRVTMSPGFEGFNLCFNPANSDPLFAQQRSTLPSAHSCHHLTYCCMHRRRLRIFKTWVKSTD